MDSGKRCFKAARFCEQRSPDSQEICQEQRPDADIIPHWHELHNAHNSAVVDPPTARPVPSRTTPYQARAVSAPGTADRLDRRLIGCFGGESPLNHSGMYVETLKQNGWAFWEPWLAPCETGDRFSLPEGHLIRCRYLQSFCLLPLSYWVVISRSCLERPQRWVERIWQRYSDLRRPLLPFSILRRALLAFESLRSMSGPRGAHRLILISWVTEQQMCSSRIPVCRSSRRGRSGRQMRRHSLGCHGVCLRSVPAAAARALSPGRSSRPQ